MSRVWSEDTFEPLDCLFFELCINVCFLPYCSVNVYHNLQNYTNQVWDISVIAGSSKAPQ